MLNISSKHSFKVNQIKKKAQAQKLLVVDLEILTWINLHPGQLYFMSLLWYH